MLIRGTYANIASVNSFYVADVLAYLWPAWCAKYVQIAVMDGKGYLALQEAKREGYDEELESSSLMLTTNGHVSHECKLIFALAYDVISQSTWDSLGMEQVFLAEVSAVI